MAVVDVKTAVRQIQTWALSLSGITSAPNEPVESSIQFPFSVSYEADGEVHPFPGNTQKKELVTIVTEFHVARGLGPSAIETALDLKQGFLDLFVDDPTINGTVDTVRWPILTQFGRLSWGTQENVHIGYRFQIPVKLNTAVSV